MKTPRYYQSEAARAVIRHEHPDKGALLVMATGCGKTYTAMLAVLETVVHGRERRVLWVAERRELLMAAYEEAVDTGINPEIMGFVGNGLGDDYDKRVVFAMKDSAIRPRRMEQLEGFDMMVCDEAHHTVSAGWQKLIAHVAPKKLMGLTATPDRADGKRLSEMWEIVYEYGMVRAIEEGFLLRPFAAIDKPAMLDLSQVKQTRRDYLAKDLEQHLLKAHIVEHTVAAIGKSQEAQALPLRDQPRTLSARELGGGVLVYCVTVEQAQLTAAALGDAGWESAVVWGDMNPEDRDTLIGAFRAGKLKVLVNVGILTEGTDLPWAQTVVLARPTTSWPLFMQICGRAVRKHGEQDAAFIIDLVGATDHHSIVSAAVLVDGVDCPESPDGAHRFLPLKSGEGRCQHCQVLIKCFQYKGGHRFKAGQCDCGAIQCPESPTTEHHFVPWEPGVRMCIHCGINSPDPVSAIVGRTNPPKLPVAWARLRMEREVWTAHLGNIGVLFNVRIGELWRPFWFAQGELTPLSRGAVRPEMSRLLTQDVARRANRVKGVYGAHRSVRSFRLAMKEALTIARQTEVWRGS